MARRLPLAILLLWLALAPAARAAGNATVPPSTDLYHEWLSGWAGDGAADALRYGLDPETGEWGYLAGVPGGLALSSAFAEPRVEHRSDGSTVIFLDERFADYLVAHIGRDGKPVFGCMPATGLREALAAPAAGAAPDR